MFVQNFINLSAAVYESLCCWQRCRKQYCCLFRRQ